MPKDHQMNNEEMLDINVSINLALFYTLDQCQLDHIYQALPPYSFMDQLED